MSHETAVLDDVMEIEAPREQSAPAILSGLPEGRNADLPQWFRARQAEAWTRFTSLPMPTRNDQAWRFSNVKALDLAPFVVNDSVSDEDRRQILERSVSLEEVAARLIYADDNLLRRDPLSEKLRALGVVVKPLERGLSEAQAMSLSVNGFVNDLVREFPMEYSVELKRLIELEMEGSVG